MAEWNWNMRGKHSGIIEESFTGPESEASCTCGWKGQTRGSKEEAEEDLKQHYRDAVESDDV